MLSQTLDIPVLTAVNEQNELICDIIHRELKQSRSVQQIGEICRDYIMTLRTLIGDNESKISLTTEYFQQETQRWIENDLENNPESEFTYTLSSFPMVTCAVDKICKPNEIVYHSRFEVRGGFASETLLSTPKVIARSIVSAVLWHK